MARHHPRSPGQEAPPLHHRALGDVGSRIHGRHARAHRHHGQGLRRPLHRRERRHRRVRARRDSVRERLRRRARSHPGCADHERGRCGGRGGRGGIGAGLRAAREGRRRRVEHRSGADVRRKLGHCSRAQSVHDRRRRTAHRSRRDRHRQGQRGERRLQCRSAREGAAEGSDRGVHDRRHREVRDRGLARGRVVRLVRVRDRAAAARGARSDRLHLRRRRAGSVSGRARREHPGGGATDNRGAHGSGDHRGEPERHPAGARASSTRSC